ncbi:hypothetical protein ACFLZW_06160 [Chloroflexota bacterium]
MKSKRQFVIILLMMIATLTAAACGRADETAIPTLEPSPTPFVPTASPTTEILVTEEIPMPTATADLETLRTSLLGALTQTPPDYTTLQSFMSGEFWIFEPFAATNYSPAEAIAEFGANALPAAAAVTYDLAVDPHVRVHFPLPADMDEYIFTTGWVDGSYTGVLLISLRPEGYVWTGVYLAPVEQQASEPIRIKFAPGAVEATMWGSLAASGIDEYVLYALKGQTMSATIFSPGDNAYLEIYGLSDGIPLVRVAWDSTAWTGVLPASQDYSIKVVSNVPVPSYQLHVYIPPLATDEPSLDWKPLPGEICQDLEVLVAGELGTTNLWLETNAPFEDQREGTYGRGCLISVSGTGADFASPHDVFQQLKNLLVNMGWTPDPQYDADGPMGTSGGFRRDSGLMVVSVGWEPSPDANCPQDQPISACPLTPEQKIYTITLSAAMR